MADLVAGTRQPEQVLARRAHQALGQARFQAGPVVDGEEGHGTHRVVGLGQEEGMRPATPGNGLDFARPFGVINPLQLGGVKAG